MFILYTQLRSARDIGSMLMQTRSEHLVGSSFEMERKISDNSISAECLATFNELRSRRKYKFIIYKLDNDKGIVVDSVVESATHDDFLKKTPG